MEQIIIKLKEALENDLPGQKAHVKMSPMRRPHGDFPERPEAKQSAVAVILTKVNDHVAIILTKRNSYNGAHSGQISFPGGRKDNSDSNLEFTARRESFEEIGLLLESDHLIGSLTEVYIPVSQFLVQPFVYHITNLPLLKPDPREVNQILYLPMKELLSESIYSTMDVRTNDRTVYRNVPCFRHDEHEIWGATALILNELRYLLS